MNPYHKTQFIKLNSPLPALWTIDHIIYTFFWFIPNRSPSLWVDKNNKQWLIFDSIL